MTVTSEQISLSIARGGILRTVQDGLFDEALRASIPEGAVGVASVDTEGAVDPVLTIVAVNETEYAAIVAKDPNTLYVVIADPE